MRPLKPILALLCLLAAVALLAAQSDANLPWSRGLMAPATSKPAGSSPPGAPAPVPAPVAATNWEDLYARADSAAQQWEARAKDLAVQAAAQLSEMDATSRAAVKMERGAPLPPAPRFKPAAGDAQTRFYAADTRGKAWRSRANALEARLQNWRSRLADPRTHLAAASPRESAYPSLDPGGSGADPGGPVKVRGYRRADGTTVAPYDRSRPATGSAGGHGRR